MQTDGNEGRSKKDNEIDRTPVLEKLGANLMLYIDYDVLVEHRRLDFITCWQENRIKREPTNACRVAHLLRLVTAMVPKKQAAFLAALDSNRQTHIAEYIRKEGKLSDMAKDMWPLLACSEIRMLEKSLEKLHLERKFLDELCSKNCISVQQTTNLGKLTGADQQRELLLMMQRRSFGDFKKLVCCLADTDQSNVASMLSTVGDEVKSRLQEYGPILKELINIPSDLLDDLITDDCISKPLKDYIASGKSESDKNQRLLDIMSRSSDKDFKTFVDRLGERGQKYVKKFLKEGGYMAYMVAETNGTSEEESRIVDNFNNFYKDQTTERAREDVHV